MNESVVVYRRFLFLKVALALALLSVVAYALHHPIGEPSGGTWLGYTLGTIGAILILWLMYFGIRKRSYGPGKVKLESWLSAHIYLGLALIVVATLHTGFQFGWNVHTLAYVLMLLVILSGTFGLYAYLRYPKLMTENRRGVTLDLMMTQVADIDRECRDIGLKLGEEINRTLHEAAQRTRIGGGMLKQLSGREKACPTEAALARIEGLAAGESAHAADLRQLVTLLTRKVDLLRRARQDVQFQALMKVWLFVHVPISFALLAALIAHIVAVFFYW